MFPATVPVLKCSHDLSTAGRKRRAPSVGPATPSGMQKAQMTVAERAKARKSRLAPFGPAKSSGMQNAQMTVVEVGRQFCRT